MVRPVDIRNAGIAADIIELLDRESAVDISFFGEHEGLSESDAVEALIAGDADIALISNGMPFRRRISTVMSMYPTVLHVGHRGGFNRDQDERLPTGTKVFAGASGSASRLMFEAAREKLHLDDVEIDYVEPLQGGIDPSRAPDMFVVFEPISRDGLDNIPAEYRAEMQFVGFGAPGDIGRGGIIDATTLLNPYMKPFVIPQGTYGDLPRSPVLTLAVDMLLVSRADLDETVVYDLVNELLRLRPALAARRPGLFSNLSDTYAAPDSTFVLHPGLLDYLQRDEPTIYERYSGVAEVMVTLFVALVSAIFAGTRMYRFARKNRIDTFYKRAMDIRNLAAEDSSEESRQAARAKLTALQDEAFHLLIHERLAADESFRIFMDLSHDIMRELATGDVPALA